MTIFKPLLALIACGLALASSAWACVPPGDRSKYLYAPSRGAPVEQPKSPGRATAEDPTGGYAKRVGVSRAEALRRLRDQSSPANHKRLQAAERKPNFAGAYYDHQAGRYVIRTTDDPDSPMSWDRLEKLWLSLYGGDLSNVSPRAPEYNLRADLNAVVVTVRTGYTDPALVPKKQPGLIIKYTSEPPTVYTTSLPAATDADCLRTDCTPRLSVGAATGGIVSPTWG